MPQKFIHTSFGHVKILRMAQNEPNVAADNCVGLLLRIREVLGSNIEPDPILTERFLIFAQFLQANYVALPQFRLHSHNSLLCNYSLIIVSFGGK
jgi:hypothetical protein